MSGIRVSAALALAYAAGVLGASAALHDGREVIAHQELTLLIVRALSLALFLVSGAVLLWRRP